MVEKNNSKNLAVIPSYILDDVNSRNWLLDSFTIFMDFMYILQSLIGL